MGKVLFGRWGNLVKDFRESPEEALDYGAEGFPKSSMFPENLLAIMSGKGLLIFTEGFDYTLALDHYVKVTHEKFCCGRCLVGIKGTRALTELMSIIGSGQGTNSTLEHLARVADILDKGAKCSVCQSAGELVKDAINHFQDDLYRAVTEGIKQQPYSYIGRLSAPCINACPSHINIPGYVEAIQDLRYEEALEIIRKRMPLPAVTGRICPAPCQTACTLANQDKAPIPIKTLKRVAADYEMRRGLTPELESSQGDGAAVAVVGAGPAGLSAAYFLNRLGHRVTVIDAFDMFGGMVGAGVPAYRQPRDVLARDAGIIMDLGVETQLGRRLGRDFSINDLFKEGFGAVMLGIGAHKSVSLGLKGEDRNIQGVYTGGIDFLRKVSLTGHAPVGKNVIIVGGGNTAIDCARTCVRLGSENVTVVYRRTPAEMPSDPHEVHDAMQEGVNFEYLTQPLEILTLDNRLTGLKLIRMELGDQDYTGRRRPKPIENSEFELAADTLIPAIGQAPDLSFLEDEQGIEVTRRGLIKVDPDTLMTSYKGVFAAGDAVTGPMTVVHGVAGGEQAARMIHQYLQTGACATPREKWFWEVVEAIEKDQKTLVTPKIESIPHLSHGPVKLDTRERIKTFIEVEQGYKLEEAFVEASRCLRCFHLTLAVYHDTP